MNRLVNEVTTLRRLPPPAMRRAIREGANVSRARLARELGVTNTAVGHWETGERTPSVRVREAYCDLLEALKDAAA